MTEIETLIDNTEENRLELPLNGQPAFVEYILGEDRITFTHTEVPEDLEGQGVGSRIAKAALMNARGRNLKVVPMCRFIAEYIAKHDEYRDLVPEDQQHLLDQED